MVELSGLSSAFCSLFYVTFLKLKQVLLNVGLLA